MIVLAYLALEMHIVPRDILLIPSYSIYSLDSNI